MPCSICAPPAARGPVLTVRKPSRSGSVCAVAPECRTPSTTASARTRMPRMRIPPCAQALISPVRGQPGDRFDDVPLRARILRFQKNRKEARGKSLRVDIHCHYLNTDAAAKIAHHNPAQFDFLARFSNDITREVNAKQVMERAARLTSIEQRLKDMDRMGIDVQAVSPA